jgi:hypothetical protein
MNYIPLEWLKNKDNFYKVRDILDKLEEDIKTDDSYTEEQAIKDLKELGETTIIEKILKK